MAAPNLRSPSTITGKTKPYAVTASLAEILANPAASGKVFKVNTIRCANVDPAVSVNLTLTLYRSSTHTNFIKNAPIYPATALILSDKNEYIYLEENDALYAQASLASKLELTLNYEEIT